MGVALAIATAAAWHSLPAERAGSLASPALWVFALAGGLQIGLRAAASIAAVTLCAALGLDWINRTKIALTQAPLTALDLRIALENPSGLWIALGWPVWTLRVVIGLCLAGVLLLGVVGTWAFRRRRAGRVPEKSWAALLAATAVLSAGVSVALTLPYKLEKVAVRENALWEPAGLARYSRAVGTVPFLLFSQVLEWRDTGLFYDRSLTADPVSRTELDAAAERYVNSSMLGRAGRPNIVVLLAESTFDPDRAFNLAPGVAHSLFAPQADSTVLTPLYVNAVGGGTWISEFETIVGLDSRLFGYSGYYTHASVAPFVRRSLATYLAERGYDTAAYYTWSGDFYNGRRAYGSYGFGRFLDGDELGLAPDADDQDVAAVTVARVAMTQRPPFLSYVVLNGNHAPHSCVHFRSRDEFTTRFAGPAGFEMNCELNEYVRRLRSTWIGFETWDRYLQDLHRTTGRGYVLAMFGDHQPHTFAGLGASFSNYDYTSVRTSRSARETFLHIRTNVQDLVSCCDEQPPPATLLPSILSAFVAAAPDDLYLPENFYLYRVCGSDALGRHLSVGAYPSGAPRTTSGRSAACADAYLKGLAGLRRAGILGGS